MKRGCFISLIAVFGIGLVFLGLVYWAFLPQYKTVEIEQDIGGKLICEMEYISDHHSWDYIIDYSYQPEKGERIFIGNGVYSGRDWNEDDQLFNVNNWTILKTGNYYGTDKIFYGDIKAGPWKEFQFTPENIEKDSLWQTSHIKTLSNRFSAECYVKEIGSDKIIVIYEYRIDTNENLTEMKLIEYELSDKPEMKKITDYNN